jgi:hypothetical protein
MVDLPVTAGDEPVGCGRYRYVATRAWWMACAGPRGGFSRAYACLAENLLREWVPRTRRRDWLLQRHVTGRQVWRAGNREDAHAEGFDVDESWPSGRWRAPYGNFCAAGIRRRRPPGGSWQRPTPRFLAGLPHEPDRLYQRLRAESPGSRPPLRCARDALRTGLVPPPVQAALYRALLLDPDTSLEQPVANADGRAGVALTAEANLRSEILINPDTGLFIGERDLLTHDDPDLDLPTGTLITLTALTTTPVDMLEALPP